MPRTTTDPKITSFTVKLTLSEADSLHRCAKILGLTKATILLRGLAWAQAEVRKREGQAAVEK